MPRGGYIKKSPVAFSYKSRWVREILFCMKVLFNRYMRIAFNYFSAAQTASPISLVESTVSPFLAISAVRAPLSKTL